jgi:hypothetical protein
MAQEPTIEQVAMAILQSAFKGKRTGDAITLGHFNYCCMELQSQPTSFTGDEIVQAKQYLQDNS